MERKKSETSTIETKIKVESIQRFRLSITNNNVNENQRNCCRREIVNDGHWASTVFKCERTHGALDSQ